MHGHSNDVRKLKTDARTTQIQSRSSINGELRVLAMTLLQRVATGGREVRVTKHAKMPPKGSSLAR